MKTKKPKSFLAIFLAGFLAGASFMYWFSTEFWPQQREQIESQINSLKFAKLDHKEFGEPVKTDQVLDRQGYSLGYSYEYKAALWASYALTADSVSVDVGRSGSFYSDPDIPEQYQVKPSDYTNTGYDKGHLAPSATIDFSKEANKETFAMSNVAFQDPKLNRQGWSKIEALERDWSKTKGKIYVITGPIYTERPKKINDVPLPVRFYKVIYAPDANKAIGFILPNKSVSSSEIWNYAMSVREVEKETGFNFLSRLDDATQNQLENNLEAAWWKKG